MQPQELQIDREDIVLLLIDATGRLLRKQSLDGVTRLEKLLFLLDQETDFEGIGLFPFEAHNFGPFSKEVYAAVEFLEGCGLIDVQEKSYPSIFASSDEDRLLAEISDEDESVQVTEKQFALTENGRVVARKIREAIAQKNPEDVRQLDSIVQKYGSRPLNQLIRYVYHQYPDMTTNSMHPEAANVRQRPDK